MMTVTRKLRNIPYLAAVFNNGSAPRGWVEIQRNDLLDEGPKTLEPLASDREAAALVARRAGMPGSAMLYNLSTGVFVQLEERPGDSDGAAAEANPQVLSGVEQLADGTDGSWWISVVPARAAFEAGLIERKREAAAYKGET
jgi:hypothetical protein